jgi:transcriptional regulator with XRE-family HTH domain
MMKQLTFGEQLKIILSRRGMTIKALAELIEEHTGKKMSRQNLTQRLGRDNFQEQDMRMIAEILGCPFTLSIMAIEDSLEGEKHEKLSDEVVILAEDEFEESEEIITQVELFEDLEEEIITEEVATKKEVAKAAGKAPAKVETSKMPAREVLAKGETSRMPAKEELAQGGVSGETGDDRPKDEHLITVGDLKDMNQELTDLEKEADFRANGVFLRVKGVDVERPKVEPKKEERPTIKERFEAEASKETSHPEEAQEESQLGEINPYTGKEYETNSVRTHPTRIGYVQVYDRSIRRWKDMTEWAFLGYQERKKAILGSRYEEPIYLD